VSNNDATDALEAEGYVSNEAEVPCLGHLGFFAVFKGTVNYPQLVTKARELGMNLSGMSTDETWADNAFGDNRWADYIPAPRRGSRAFSYAVKALEYKVGWVENSNWENGRGENLAELTYKVEMIQNSREYKLVRHWRGFNVQSQQWDTQNEPLFRLKYIRPSRGSSLATWTSRYVRHAWGALNEHEAVPVESDLADMVEVTPYDASVLVDADLLARVTRNLVRALRVECTTVDQDGLRRVIRGAIQNHDGIQFGGSSGGVYYIPDSMRDQSYLERLLPFSLLINWFGDMNTPEVEESSLRRDADGNIIPYYAPQTTFRLLGYVDSPRQMEYLRADIAREIGANVNAYYDELLKVVSETDVEDLPREVDRLFAERRKLEQKLGNMRSIVGSGVKAGLSPMGDVASGIDARLSAITTTSAYQASRIRDLMRLDFDEA